MYEVVFLAVDGWHIVRSFVHSFLVPYLLLLFHSAIPQLGLVNNIDYLITYVLASNSVRFQREPRVSEWGAF